MKANNRWVLCLLALVCSLSVQADDNPPAPAQSSGFVNTYTYLRCYYPESTAASTVSTNYVWARDPANASYYRLWGNWRSALNLVANMFYTNVPQEQLDKVCQSTLAAHGISQPYAFSRAADQALSLDYTIWTLTDPASQAKIDRIVTFGDSLSDTGNVFNASNWTTPIRTDWYHGHFSNGEVWVERLAKNVKLPLYNWAVGGAAADRYLILPGVVQQIASWADYMKFDNGYRPDRTLFTMLIGGNDLINYGRSVDQILAAQSTALEALINAGARHILLLNLPDLSKAPIFKTRSDSSKMAVQVQDYNQRLAMIQQALINKYGADLNIQLFDSWAFMNGVLANPEKFGIANTQDTCLNEEGLLGKPFSYAIPLGLDPACTDPDTYMFWNNLHPTRKMHGLIGDAITATANAMINP